MIASGTSSLIYEPPFSLEFARGVSAGRMETFWLGSATYTLTGATPASNVAVAGNIKTVSNSSTEAFGNTPTSGSFVVVCKSTTDVAVLPNYQEVGSILGELAENSTDDDWRITKSVRDAALRVASALMASAIPAPCVFNHGAKSVVFNWDKFSLGRREKDIYLTITDSGMSALISYARQIEFRRDYTVDELFDIRAALLGIVSAQKDESVITQISQETNVT